MRKSSLYLGLSIISLLVGVALGEAKEWGFSCERSCPFVCETDDELAEYPRGYHYSRAFMGVQTGDFDDMARHAQICVNDDASSLAYMLLAYARRGQGLHTESHALYDRALKLERQGRNDEVLVIDCLVGRAANSIAVGDLGYASKDLREAMSMAKRRAEVHDDRGAHYQLACVYATRARLADDKQAENDLISALSELKLAFDRGDVNVNHMSGDLDLVALRENEHFQRLCK